MHANLLCCIHRRFRDVRLYSMRHQSHIILEVLQENKKSLSLEAEVKITLWLIMMDYRQKSPRSKIRPPKCGFDNIFSSSPPVSPMYFIFECASLGLKIKMGVYMRMRGRLQLGMASSLQKEGWGTGEDGKNPAINNTGLILSYLFHSASITFAIETRNMFSGD